MTGYVVHYSDGVTNMTESVPASSTGVRVTNLISCHIYTFSVEATSEHFSGLSMIIMLTLGKIHYWCVLSDMYIWYNIHFYMRCLAISKCQSRNSQFNQYLSPVGTPESLQSCE